MPTDKQKLQLELETTLAKFEQEMRRAVNTGTISSTAIEKRFTAMGAKVANSGKKAAAGLTGVMNVSRGGRFVLQNTAAQLGDIAVQLEAGTNPMRVMGQQLPQILGGFGALRGVLGIVAPLLSVVAAVGFPVAAMMLAVGAAGDKSEEKVQTFAEKVSEAESALREMSATADTASTNGLDKLEKKYGAVTAALQDMVLAQLDQRRRAALGHVTEVIGDVTSEIAKASEEATGVVGAALASAGTEQAKAEAEAYRQQIEKLQTAIDQRKRSGFFVDPGELVIVQQMRAELAALEGDVANIGDLASELKLDPNLISELAEAQVRLEGARDAGNFSEMADQLGTIRALLLQAGDAVSIDVVDGITDAEAIARDMAARLEEGKAAAEGLASTNISGFIADGAAQALLLANRLGIALQNARGLDKSLNRSAGISEPSKGGLSFGLGGGGDDGTVGNASLGFGNLSDDYRRTVSDLSAPASSGGVAGGRSGGGGGSKASARKVEPLFSIAEAEIEKLRRSSEVLGKTKAEVAELTVKHKLLDEAKKRGMELTDELTAKIDAEAAEVRVLAENYEAAADKVKALEDLQGEFKDSTIDAALGSADAFETLIDTIKRAAVEYALFGSGPLSGLIGGDSGSFSGLLGGVLGQIPSFDGGGSTGAGDRVGGLDGKGGFLAINHPNETIIDHTKTGGATSGVQRIVLEVGVNDQGQLGVIAAQAGAAAGVEVLVKRGPAMVNNTIGSGQANKVMSSQFGLRNKAK